MIISALLGGIPPLLVVLDVILSVAVVIVFWLWRRRRQTRRLLQGCNLPTVTWTPRFLNYIPKQEGQSKKMKSSAITGILPRMDRLGGPFGMYGTVYGFSIPVVHVAHPVPARCILMETNTSPGRRRRMSITASSGASKAPAYNHFKNFSGNGVFTADGDEWKEKRASVIHCLLKGISNSNSPATQRLEREANYAANSVIAEVEQVRQEQKRGKGQAVLVENIVPMMQRGTIGLIYRYITHDDKRQVTVSSQISERSNGQATTISPGLESTSSSSSSLSSLATPTDEAHDDTIEALPADICSPNLLQSYLQSVTDIRMIILAQSRSFWFLLPRWVYRSFSRMYKEEENTMGPIREFASRACERAQPGSPLAMLRERPSHAAASTGELSQDMIDEAITLLFAGQDTSAATLSWTLHLLSLYPHIQERLAKEINDVILAESNQGTDSNRSETTRRFTKKLVAKMPFLDAVIKESMRLYPVAPFVVRKLQHEVIVQDEDKVSTTTLPPGAFACIWIYGLHRNPKLWNRASDFVPDRWIDPSLRALDAGQNMVGAYMPFAAGPRSCVGQPLANVILRIVLARLVHRYSFSDERLTSNGDAEKLRKDMQAGFTVLPVGGLKLSVSIREGWTTTDGRKKDNDSSSSSGCSSESERAIIGKSLASYNILVGSIPRDVLPVPYHRCYLWIATCSSRPMTRPREQGSTWCVREGARRTTDARHFNEAITTTT